MSESLSIADVLERAADLIEPEGRWTQGAFSRNADGSADLDEDETAASNPVCWCALGAIAEVAGADVTRLLTFASTNTEVQAKAALYLSRHLNALVEDWNDNPDRAHSEVVAKLREAAALARVDAL
jgi:hypothetical protein